MTYWNENRNSSEPLEIIFDTFSKNREDEVHFRKLISNIIKLQVYHQTYIILYHNK